MKMSAAAITVVNSALMKTTRRIRCPIRPGNDFRGCVQGMEARGDASEPPKGGEPHQRHLGHPLDKLDEALDVEEAVNSSTY